MSFTIALMLLWLVGALLYNKALYFNPTNPTALRNAILCGLLGSVIISVVIGIRFDNNIPYQLLGVAGNILFILLSFVRAKQSHSEKKLATSGKEIS